MDAKREYNKVYKEVVDELGGEKKATYFQKNMASRLSGVVLQLNQLEGDLIEGKRVDANTFVRVQNVYARLVKDLGIVRPPDYDEDALTLEDFLEGDLKTEKPDGW